MKIKKIDPNNWQYRGGFIEHLPRFPGRRGNWGWRVCGAGGWVNSKSEAKKKIDDLLASAAEILKNERES